MTRWFTSIPMFPVRALLLAIGLLLAAGALRAENAADATSVDRSRILAAESSGEWLVHGRTWSDDRFSPLHQVNTQTIGSLALAWSYDLDAPRGQQATPLMADGVLYFSTSWSKVVALDARTGRSRWVFDPDVAGQTGFKACCDVVNRGVALWGNKVYVGTLDGRLIALDRQTGKPVWSVMTVDPTHPYTITGAPRVANGKVFIGNAGGEYGVRGYVSAYDAETGKQVWRFFTVPGPPSDRETSPAMKMAAKTWHGQWWKYGGGGTVWDSMTFDPESNLLFFGVGNGAPWRQSLRSPGGGDNLFLSSIVAVNADSGSYVWHYQVTPGDTWDFDATQQMILADLAVDGKPQKVLMQASKNGFFYELERRTGRLLSATPFVDVQWASRIDLKTGRPQEAPGARYTKGPFVMVPSAFAAHNWYPMSYSHQTGWVYIPVMEVPFKYVGDDRFKFRPGGWNLGIDITAGALPDDMNERRALRPLLKGRLIAWDPVAGKERWRVDLKGPPNGGTLATAGGLVFQGTAEARFVAYDAREGKRLWEFATQSGVIAPPITYELDGEQYVAVLAGWGGGYSVMSPFIDASSGNVDTPRRLLVFKLHGTASLPPVQPEPVRMPAIPTDAWPGSTAVKGKSIYYENCVFCHGDSAVGGRSVPDLRYSAMLMSADAWRTVVIDGALASRGMVSFRRWLSDADAEAVRAYVGGEAKRLSDDLRRTATSH